MSICVLNGFVHLLLSAFSRQNQDFLEKPKEKQRLALIFAGFFYIF